MSTPLRSFGRYEVAQQLGAGAFGAVYRAWDEKLGRHVALKLLHADFHDDPSIRARFEREAKIMATLQHPHIVPIHDFGEQDGTLFIVMALFAGGTLQRQMQARSEAGQPFTSEETLAILEPVCSALDRAHSLGVVHRDLKPGNILFDESGKLAITDFGIARIFAGANTRATLTASGQEIGTPLYMAPEQWKGAKEQIDGRTDLYALGCLAYHLLTGAAPFAGDSAYSLMHAHMFGTPPKPSDSRKDLPAPWDQGVARLLAKDPADRFESAAAFLKWLRDALGGKVAPLPGPRTLAPAKGPAATAELPEFATANTLITGRRQSKLPWLVAGAALIVCAGLAAGVYLRRPGPNAGSPGLDGPGGPGGEPRRENRPPPTFVGKDPAQATLATPHVASLGLRFVPVQVEGGRPLLFSRSETRVRDFRAFVNSPEARMPGGREERYRYESPMTGERPLSLTARGWVDEGATWEKPGFPQTEDHPVTCVSFHDAMCFAEWLTIKEYEAGQLPRGWRYRVPFASEWSTAAATMGGDNQRNYAGMEARDANWPPNLAILSGWSDSFPRTAPASNSEILSGLRGNVWEWTLPQDPAVDRNGGETRGGGWSTNRPEETELAYSRPEPRSLRRSDLGFRLVLVQEGPGKPQPPAPFRQLLQQRRAEANSSGGNFAPGQQVVPQGRGAPAFQVVPTAVPPEAGQPREGGGPPGGREGPGREGREGGPPPPGQRPPPPRGPPR